MAFDARIRIRRTRGLLLLFITGLVLSGLTAFPIRTEISLLNALIGPATQFGGIWPAMASWIARVDRGVSEAGQEYPFLFYGTDWLAFAHIVIAVAFLGAVRDPIKNIWVIEFGMIVCVLVVPFALIAGGVRGIPIFWRLIDCSFGVLGIIPLWLARRCLLTDAHSLRSPD